MSTYYKIVSDATVFTYAYNINPYCQIPSGSVFTAQQPQIQNEKNVYCIKKPIPVLHFCDNAFDTMLWYCYNMGGFDESALTFYEIQPLTPVVKEKCCDDGGLYQCGANQIKIIRPIEKYEMFKRALNEFRQNPKAKTELYPNLQMQKIISDWTHHQQSKYVY